MARKRPKEGIVIRKKNRPRGLVGPLPRGYAELLDDLKTRIRAAQVKAVLAVNRELIQLYWDTGRIIVERQQRDGWGAGVIERLARDVRRAFPGLQGFSRTNLFRMRAFYLAYADSAAKVPQPVGQLGVPKVPQLVGQLAEAAAPPILAEIPWGHNVTLVEHLKDAAERLWYARAAVHNGWSRALLAVQIESDLHGRQGHAVNNFAATLLPPQSDLAQQVLKDPYIFDFLALGEEAHERDLERELLRHVEKFLLELGVGFAFVGRQVAFEIGGKDYSIDLLFYHLRLRCFVVIDLKMRDFEPEFAGKMNFYLSTIDDQMRHPEDRPSVGLILCKARNRVIAEYAVRDIQKPIGIAEWQTRLVKSLPKQLRGSLPSIAELEAELGRRPTKKHKRKSLRSPD
jgi:predicted nuclease of restriction endonuclease-like (RecB) superfamily